MFTRAMNLLMVQTLDYVRGLNGQIILLDLNKPAAVLKSPSFIAPMWRPESGPTGSFNFYCNKGPLFAVPSLGLKMLFQGIGVAFGDVVVDEGPLRLLSI
jgi:hypothetical protein